MSVASLEFVTDEAAGLHRRLACESFVDGSRREGGAHDTSACATRAIKSRSTHRSLETGAFDRC